MNSGFRSRPVPPAEPLAVFDCPLDGIRLVEASAGTGKTWNICALYLRLLLERGIEAPGILVVTFSITATAELRERIRDRLIATRAALRERISAAGNGGDSAGGAIDRAANGTVDVDGAGDETDGGTGDGTTR